MANFCKRCGRPLPEDGICKYCIDTNTDDHATETPSNENQQQEQPHQNQYQQQDPYQQQAPYQGPQGQYQHQGPYQIGRAHV